MPFPIDIRGIYQSELEVEDPGTQITEKVVVVADVQRYVIVFKGPSSSDPEVKLKTAQKYSSRMQGDNATVTISDSENFGNGAAGSVLPPDTLTFRRNGAVRMEDGTEQFQFSFKVRLPAFRTGAKTWTFTKTGKQEGVGGEEWYTPVKDPHKNDIGGGGGGKVLDFGDESDSEDDKGTSNAQLIVIAVIMMLAAALSVRVT